MKLAVLLTLSLLVAGSVLGEIYKWTDNNGKVHFTDQKPWERDSKEIKLKINTYKAVSYDTSIFNTGKKVVMYSTSWCGYCKKAKRYFKREGIRFTEYDIEKNKKAKKDYMKMGANGVPVILVGNKRMNGFSEKGFEQIYK